MREIIVSLVSAALSTVGYSILFNMAVKRIPFAALGGLLTWAIYLICERFLGGLLLPNLISAIFAGIYSEVFARILKAPSTVFILPSIIPLVPGAGLYYTLFNLISKNNVLFVEYFQSTLTSGLGIAAGMMVSAILGNMLTKKTPEKRIKNDQN